MANENKIYLTANDLASMLGISVGHLAFKSSPFRKEEKQAPVKQIQQKTNRKKVSQPVRQP